MNIVKIRKYKSTNNKSITIPAEYADMLDGVQQMSVRRRGNELIYTAIEEIEYDD